jgi:hypothetical protein
MKREEIKKKIAQQIMVGNNLRYNTSCHAWLYNQSTSPVNGYSDHESLIELNVLLIVVKVLKRMKHRLVLHEFVLVVVYV